MKPYELAKHIQIDPETQCWLWMRYTDSRGYGRTRVDGTYQLVHRVMYTFFTGETPFQLHHECENKRCCNPHHLVPMSSAKEHALAHIDKGFYPCGHLRTDENTQIQNHKDRRCRMCNRLKASQYYKDKLKG
jgi:HNH endonuclease